MTRIIKANEYHAQLLSDLAALTLMESHGHSAPAGDMNFYVEEKYNAAVFKKELEDPRNHYHLLYHNEKLAGFSNIILNCPYPNSKFLNISKLERIYLLKEFYSLGLGAELFEFNLNLAKENGQAGIWLFVWKENPRAVDFYTKKGFVIIGSHDFRISKNHSNPNHQMFLEFK